MLRRTFLASLGLGVAVGGYTYGVNEGDLDQTFNDAKNATNGVLGSSDKEPGVYEFGSFSPGFERAEWIEGGTLEVEFSDDHDMDVFGIRYESKSSFKDDIVRAEAPSYGETVEIGLLDEMAGSNPPAGTYNLYAYKGTIGILTNITEVMGNVSFDISPEIEVESIDLVDDTNISLQLTNNGNAPAFLDSIDAGERSSLGTIIESGESVLTRTDKSPFTRDEECIVVPTEAEIELNTRPKTDTSAVFNSPHDEEERFCTVSF